MKHCRSWILHFRKGNTTWKFITHLKMECKLCQWGFFALYFWVACKREIHRTNTQYINNVESCFILCSMHIFRVWVPFCVYIWTGSEWLENQKFVLWCMWYKFLLKPPPDWDIWVISNLQLDFLFESSYTLPRKHHTVTLTHWGWDKVNIISQTTFSSAFSWMKMYELGLKFHWSLFLRVQLTIFQHWVR